MDKETASAPPTTTLPQLDEINKSKLAALYNDMLVPGSLPDSAAQQTTDEAFNCNIR